MSNVTDNGFVGKEEFDNFQTYFYIAVGIISGVLIVTVVFVLLLYIIVEKLQKLHSKLSDALGDKYTIEKLKRPHLRNDIMRSQVANSGDFIHYDHETDESFVRQKSINPLPNRQPIRNQAMIHELKRNNRQGIPNQYERQRSSSGYDVENKNFFY